VSSSVAAPWARVTVLLVAIVGAMILAKSLTGSLIPADSHANLVFQNGLLILVLGSSIIEHKFTKPADAVVNGLMGIVTLIPVYPDAPRAAWILVFGLCLTVFAASSICVAISERPGVGGFRRKLADVTYRIAATAGQARFLYSILILFGVFSFYSIRTTSTVVLLVYWAIYMWAWSAGLPVALTSLFQRTLAIPATAIVIRVDAPNIVRAELVSGSEWIPARPKACRRADGTAGLLLPLYAEVQANSRIGTGLFVPYQWPGAVAPLAGQVLDPPASQLPSPSQVSALVGGDESSALIGFVVEGSEIGAIRFEIWDAQVCQEGQLIYTNVSGSKVYYQVVSGETREEALEAHSRHGFQVGVAAQVGMFAKDRGFHKYPWLPPMNTPVFAVPESFGAELTISGGHDFVVGTIPKSLIPVSLRAKEAFDHHIAILGVTGSGKTELAFDLIRHAVKEGSKVIAVDLTARYSERLEDLTPKNLSLSPALAAELSAKLFAVETGDFGAKKEKEALKAFSDKLTADITASVKTFLETRTDDTRVGVITLPEISNTKATLYITELYLTITLNYAKNNPKTAPRTLIVLEEAHTVIPETSTMGLGDYESRGLVGKIAQIALQGRKYRVGLLIVAQRTATVSKTVLTQCNTIISFSCIDDTSINFLANVFGSEYAALLPVLPRLHVVAYGRAIQSQRPLIVQIPFRTDKAEGDAGQSNSPKLSQEPETTPATPVVKSA